MSHHRPHDRDAPDVAAAVRAEVERAKHAIRERLSQQRHPRQSNDDGENDRHKRQRTDNGGPLVDEAEITELHRQLNERHALNDSNQLNDFDSDDDFTNTVANTDVPESAPVKDSDDSNWNSFIRGCRSVFAHYTRLGTIDEGTYGVVHRALDRDTNTVVALKKVKFDSENDGNEFPITAIREVNLLLTLSHPNIVRVKEVVTGRDDRSIYMVMNYSHWDLKCLYKIHSSESETDRPFAEAQIKLLVYQLLSAVDYLHSRSIMHRDIKMANLLYNNDSGSLQLCDFGLARKLPVSAHGSIEREPLTPLVVTLWFRAPELLMGLEAYTPAIDIWSVGCVLAELLLARPLFPGRGEMGQLGKIFALLGTPSVAEWPGLVDTSYYQQWTIRPAATQLHTLFPNCGADSVYDLLSSMFVWDPQQRITAKQALRHRWFTASPAMASESTMPKFGSPTSGNRLRRSDL